MLWSREKLLLFYRRNELQEMPWTRTASAPAVPMLLPTATAEQECIGCNQPSTLHYKRPAAQPLASSNPISCSHTTHPECSGNLHQGVWRAEDHSCHPRPAHSHPQHRKQSGFTASHQAVTCGGWGEDNPRAEQTAAGGTSSNHVNYSCTGLPTSHRGTAKGLEETHDEAEHCIQVCQPVPQQQEHSQPRITKVEITGESLVLTQHQGQEAETTKHSWTGFVDGLVGEKHQGKPFQVAAPTHSPLNSQTVTTVLH